jgi:hypothetical protein
MSYAQERIDKITKEFTERFKDHVATFTDLAPNCSVLEWRNKDGSSADHFVAVLHYITLPIKQCALMIYGDLDEATFVWYHSMSWESFESVSLGYLCSKCRASEVGNRFVTWDQREAAEAIDESSVEHKGLNDGKDRTYTAEDWREWLDTYCDITDGTEDLYEGLADCGEVVHDRAIAYLTGIKMALKQQGRTKTEDSNVPQDLTNLGKVTHGRDCIKGDS